MKSTRFYISPLVLVLLLSCGGSGGDFNLISIEEEWQLGAQLSRDIARQVPLLNDAAAQAYITEMGQRIVRQSPMANLPWNFHIVRDNQINAFAIPGGHVYIYTGLINNADNASELAGVMAHEISHVVARHSTEQISRQYGISILAGLVLGQNPNVLAELAAQIVAGGALARFSRSAEQEADRLGLGFMNNAGYNPRGMVTMFQELLEHQRRQPSAVERFFSTHPLTQDRIRDVENQITKLPQRATSTDDPGFQQLRGRV
jgi:predicted Zn-dependent protease